MASEVIMPKAGMAMEEGTIVQWLKKEGDSVRKGEILLEIETDKVVMEVEAESTGTLLAIVAQDGETVPVTQTIAYIGEAGETVELEPDAGSGPAKEKPADAARMSERQAAEDHGMASLAGRVAASPAAKRRAKELGIALESVAEATGSAPLRVADVERFRDSGNGRRNGSQTRTRLSGVRRATADAMSRSHRDIPPTTLHAECDVTAVREAVAQLREREQDPPRFNDVVVHAVARAVGQCPWMTTRLEADDLVATERVDIGVAVATEDGLIVPVLRAADRLTLAELHTALAALVLRTRRRKLEAAELTGATFTISNLGMYGIGSFTPIVPPDQSAILGIGALAQRLEMVDQGIVARDVVPVSLTLDHRVIDGAQGALFIRKLAEILADPAIV